MLCSELLSNSTATLTFQEALDFVDAHPADRTCVQVPGIPVCADDQSSGTPATIPARGAAICMISSDWGNMKEELEEACRDLGSRCTLQMKTVIAKMKTALDRAQSLPSEEK